MTGETLHCLLKNPDKVRKQFLNCALFERKLFFTVAFLGGGVWDHLMILLMLGAKCCWEGGSRKCILRQTLHIPPALNYLGLIC